MTPEKLLEAIGNIDDAFIEESAIRRRKLFGGNWGLVASAACLCLVIGGVIFLHNAGWMPYFPGLTQPTEPPMPTATDPTETTAPIETTVPPETTAPIVTTVPPETTESTTPEMQPNETLPDSQLQAFTDMLGDSRSWYNRALACEYAKPEELELYWFFYCGFPDESQKPTAEEWEQLKDKQGFDENCDLIRLPEYKMDQVLQDYFGISLEDIPAEGFSRMTYLESTDCWYFMITGYYGVERPQVLAVETLENGTVHVRYEADYWGVVDLMLQPNGDGYRILSNQKMQ